MSADSSRALFLSYAREDTDAARRIADALRGFSIEVWFDQYELRGGDTWDAKIRRQIKECVLFMPVVSAHTQERGEGYFRLEWKLAVERAQLMAEGVPFFAPVVIDDTPDSHAAVPAEFLRVQWTRLPGALPSPEFVAQVKRLLDAPRKPADAIRSGSAARSDAPHGVKAEAHSAGSGPSGAAPPQAKRRALAWAVGAMAVAAVVLVAVWMKPTPSATPHPGEFAGVATGSAGQPRLDFAAAKSTDKSIAVLPFANLSDDKESGFFADGVQEDILTNLALVRELRVVSRTSVAQYRDTKKKMPDIGRELGVTYLLEGSVRRAGSSVRISAQLIQAATDAHLWAKGFDGELKDVFALQSTVATEIAGALHAVVSPQEQKLIARRPTENAAAYDLYVKARRIRDSAVNTRSMVEQQLALLESAVVLDAKFALAWGDLAWCHGWMYRHGRDRSAARAQKTRQAIDTAIRLAPGTPETSLNLGYFWWFMDYDLGRAEGEFQKILEQNPNNLAARFGLGFVQGLQGKFRERLENHLIVARRDPANGDYAVQVAKWCRSARRYDEAIFFLRRAVVLDPGDPWAALKTAELEFLRRGSTQETDEFFARLSIGHRESATGVRERMNWALMCGRWKEAIQLDRGQPWKQEDVEEGAAWIRNASDALNLATALIATGDRPRAVVRLQSSRQELRARLEEEPTHETGLAYFAAMEALLGNRDEARRRMLSSDTSTLTAGYGQWARAFVLAWTGDLQAAITEYAERLQQASGLNVHVMRRDASYFPLHGDPRFEALLNDPKNNAPLF